MYKNKWESLITFPFVLFGGERGISRGRRGIFSFSYLCSLRTNYLAYICYFVVFIACIRFVFLFAKLHKKFDTTK